MERLTAFQYFLPKQKRFSHDLERENNAKIDSNHAFIRHSCFSLRVAITAAIAGMSGITVSSIAVASSSTMTQDELRAIAPGPLQSVDVPRIPNLHEFVQDQRLGILLGKALFWDQAVGSDEVTACASCHFKAGADNRSKNQLSPGLLDRTPGVNPAMFDQLDGGKGGPNYQLTIDDFPFSKDINDVVSSQGVYKRLFNGLISDSSQPAVQTPYASGQWQEDCTSDADGIFHIGGLNTRRVEPRNAPTVINAVFNHRNFWDGRANHQFNGFDAFGARSNQGADAGVLRWNHDPRQAPQKVQILLDNASLASQAMLPPLSTFEGSCESRRFRDIGRKLLTRRALAKQKIAADDSVLGGDVRHASGAGLSSTYEELIRRVFRKEWWGSQIKDADGYTQMEANFGLFWGLAIQMYETTLVSGQTRYDRWAKGYATFDEDEHLGLEVFVRADRGNCLECHGGPEFTGAAVSQRGGPDGEAIERMQMADGTIKLYDGGFYNIGVRQTLEDVALGATSKGQPLCFSRQVASAVTAGDPSLIVDGNFNPIPAGDPAEGGFPGPVSPGEQVACDGAFKSSTLRNIELTAPYFHNGGVATLEDVVRFYKDGFESTGFAEENVNDLHPSIPEIDIRGGERDALVKFMLTLTDERVRHERAPFDHPELCIPNGHTGDTDQVQQSAEQAIEAETALTCLPAVGRAGVQTPMPNFLGLVEPVEDMDVTDPEDDRPEGDAAEEEPEVEAPETEESEVEEPEAEEPEAEEPEAEEPEAEETPVEQPQTPESLVEPQPPEEDTTKLTNEQLSALIQSLWTGELERREQWKASYKAWVGAKKLELTDLISENRTLHETARQMIRNPNLTSTERQTLIDEEVARYNAAKAAYQSVLADAQATRQASLDQEYDTRKAAVAEIRLIEAQLNKA